MEVRLLNRVKPIFTPRPAGPSLLLIRVLAPRSAAFLLVLSALLPTVAAAAEPNPASPAAVPGTLFIVGGGTLPDAFRRHFLELAGGKNARIVFIPTASTKAEEAQLFPTWQFFQSQPVKSAHLLHTRDRKRADDPDFVKPLHEATGVWFTGGDQSLLGSAYHGTAVEKALHRVLGRGGVVGGTSAGAAVMSTPMIVGGKVTAELADGFGLLAGVIIDQHFQQRNRFRRLLGVLDRYPECLGVGIDEETALVVRGQTGTVAGKGNVWACLCARGKTPESIKPLKEGEKLDLGALIKTAYARAKPVREGSPITPAERTTTLSTKP